MQPDTGMKTESIASVEFTNVYGKLVARASRAVRAYVKKPDETNTHDMRVAIRRVNILTRSIPKKKMSKSMKRYRKNCRKILRLTSRVRDLDIIHGKLAAYKTDGAVPSMLKSLVEEREELATESMKTARSLRDSARQRVSSKNPSKFTRYLEKALREFDGEITRLMPVVANDERRVSELHALKKYLRRLRYLLELLPQNRRLDAACGTLRNMQNALGEIRDGDVVLQYLSKSEQSHLAKELLLKEGNFRHSQYETFVKDYWGRLRGERTSFLVIAGIES